MWPETSDRSIALLPGIGLGHDTHQGGSVIVEAVINYKAFTEDGENDREDLRVVHGMEYFVKVELFFVQCRFPGANDYSIRVPLVVL